MSSTGMALSGKFHVTWSSTTSTGLDIERVGETQLPDTLENEVNELVSNMATRRDIIEKTGWQDPTVTCFFNPDTWEKLLTDKQAGNLGTLTYTCSAADGGNYTATYDAKIISVSGASGDVEGNMESFDVQFGIIARTTASGALGTQAYE